jgi:hypothetical protein
MLMHQTTEEIRDIAIIVTVGIIAAVVWYFAWVKPNDEFMGLVMDCMGPDSSRAAFDQCVTLLKQSQL